MVRLIVAAAVAGVLGYCLGTLQFYAGYGRVDERFADLSVYEPVPDGSESAAAKDKSATDKPLKSDGPDASANKAAKLQIAGGTTYDFGTMQQGSKKNYSFVFKNIGNAPMDLEVAGSSCRCTIGTLADSVLDPGEETAVTLEWKATGVLDQFSQTATIVTNDPDHRNVLLTVRGIVTRTILIEPAVINFGDIPVGQGATQSAYVFGYAEVPLEVKKVVWGDEKTLKDVDIVVSPYEVEPDKFPQHVGAKGAAKIDLTLKNGIPLGKLNSRLVVDTNIENVSNVDVAVNGAVVGDIQFLPNPSFEPEKNLLEFERVPHGAGMTRKLFVSVQGKHRDTIKLKVDEVVPKESLNVSIGEPTRQQNRTIIPVTFDVPKDAPPVLLPGTSANNFGKVVIKTNHPDIPQLKISLRIIVE